MLSGYLTLKTQNSSDEIRRRVLTAGVVAVTACLHDAMPPMQHRRRADHAKHENTKATAAVTATMTTAKATGTVGRAIGQDKTQACIFVWHSFIEKKAIC